MSTSGGRSGGHRRTRARISRGTKCGLVIFFGLIVACAWPAFGQMIYPVEPVQQKRNDRVVVASRPRAICAAAAAAA